MFPAVSLSASIESRPMHPLRLNRYALLGLVVLLLAALFGAGVLLGASTPRSSAAEPALVAAATTTRTGTGVDAPAPDEPTRDFLFQDVGYTTENQGGQTMNMYFHYRYNPGIATADIPNYVDLRTQALKFMADVDITDNPYWETLDLDLCTQLKKDYPIEAISCQLQFYPDDRAGLPYEPGYHGTTTTIGDIPALAFAGPLDSTE
jgi:hypothetical protein